MKDPIKLLDVVAVVRDCPERQLVAGQVGTVVETLGEDAFEIEFVDDRGHTYATAALKADDLMVLHYTPAETV